MTITLRTGDACETPNRSFEFLQPRSSPFSGAYAGGVPGSLTFSVTFESDRQKLFRPSHGPDPSHWLKTSTAPLITTPLGVAPRPATCV